MEAYRKEYQGFKDRDAVRVVIPPRGANVLGSQTRTDYKVEQGFLQKRKVRLCARGDQHAYGVDDTYSQVLKATGVRSMTAIAAEHGCNIYKTDTKQAFLYGDLEDDEPIYITPPDWWLEQIPEGHVVPCPTTAQGSLRNGSGCSQTAHEDLEVDGG